MFQLLYAGFENHLAIVVDQVSSRLVVAVGAFQKSQLTCLSLVEVQVISRQQDRAVDACYFEHLTLSIQVLFVEVIALGFLTVATLD